MFRRIHQRNFFKVDRAASSIFWRLEGFKICISIEQASPLSMLENMIIKLVFGELEDVDILIYSFTVQCIYIMTQESILKNILSERKKDLK